MRRTNAEYLDLPAMIMTRKGKRDAAGRGFGEYLRPVRQQEDRQCGIDSAESGGQARAARGEVVDPRDGEGAFFGVDHLMTIHEEPDSAPVEDRAQFGPFAVPTLVVSEDGEGAVGGSDLLQLPDAGRKKHHGIGDEIAGNHEQVGPEIVHTLHIARYLFLRHVDAGMDVAELNYPRRPAKRQGELGDSVRLAGVGRAVPGQDEGRGRGAGYPGLEKASSLDIEGRRSAFRRTVEEEANKGALEQTHRIDRAKEESREDAPEAPYRREVVEDGAYDRVLVRVRNRLGRDVGVRAEK